MKKEKLLNEGKKKIDGYYVSQEKGAWSLNPSN